MTTQYKMLNIFWGSVLLLPLIHRLNEDVDDNNSDGLWPPETVTTPECLAKNVLKKCMHNDACVYCNMFYWICTLYYSTFYGTKRGKHVNKLDRQKTVR